MHILVGLGNPGPKYAGHRHNIGFMAVDEIHRRHGSDFSPWRKRFQAESAEGVIGTKKVLLLKPATFMNESGRSIGEATRFFKLPSNDVTVLYDELDLAPGKVRIKNGGGSGGHNGIRSMDAHLGKNYTRVRLGIGHPGSKEQVTHHVLGDFSKADKQWLHPLLEAIADNADLLVVPDSAGFMNKITLATGTKHREKPDSKQKKKSHIHQARTPQKRLAVPEKGPMADMLKKLFGKE